MKHLLLLILVITSMFLTACTGGGSGDGVFTHQQIADNFVWQLNYDLDYDVEIVKTNTKQWDYIVVYDHDLNSYDAYDLSEYYLNMDIDYFMYKYEPHFYYDLDYLGNNIYEHYNSGVRFTKSKNTSADQAKVQELVDNIKVKNSIEKLTVQFGLPPQRAKTIAAYGLQIHKNKSQMTTYQYDQYSKAILGSTISEIQGAINSHLSGNANALDSIYKKAAKTNNISKAHVKKLADLFIKN